MRLAIISDVHADVYALRDALAQGERLVCDAVVCAGDVVGYGVFPEETVALLREKKVPCVRGNHDRWATDPNVAGGASGLLSDDALAYLASLPRVWNKVIDGVRVAMCHGTPRSDMDGVVPGMATVDAVRRWLGATGAEVLIVGHTHVPCVLSGLEGGMIVNPGALLRDRVGGDLPVPVIFDPQKGAFVESQAVPRGTFGVLDLPSKQFTVYLASDGSEVSVPVVKVGVVDRRY
jgi:putative phosphoesterase